jgi:hypothetical protein
MAADLNQTLNCWKQSAVPRTLTSVGACLCETLVPTSKSTPLCCLKTHSDVFKVMRNPDFVQTTSALFFGFTHFRTFLVLLCRN